MLLVLLDGVTAGARDLTHHGDGKVHELDGHDRVLGEAARGELSLDERGDLGTGEALDMELAHDREVDVAVLVDSITGDGLGIVGGHALGHTAQTLGDVREVEEVGQLVVGRVDYDRYLILGTEADVILSHRYRHPAGVSILEIGDVGRCGTGGQQDHQRRDKRQSFQVHIRIIYFQ